MRFIRLKEVMNITGLGRATVYKYIANEHFPKSVSLGDRAVAWIESEIHDWMLERVAKRDDLEAQS
ncbi:AlpA family transcriptional regulator [Psychromonas sp. MME2]|uniref:helix-turn-helix transcriptional regulator n=1 Tax=unclassified Psychromonas TaxID=2614957 RepID=UPI00339BF0EF